jgi:hypothetical protein
MASMSESTTGHNMFHKPQKEDGGFPVTAVSIAVVAILILVIGFVALGRRKPEPNTPLTLRPNAPYAANIEVTGIEMSEADSQLGGKSTYIDGHIVNHGQSTVTGIMAQVAFTNSVGMPPQVGQTQMLRITSRDPYVDTEMLSSQPLAPNEAMDFRLIFETVPANWNMQQPEIHLTQISTK